MRKLQLPEDASPLAQEIFRRMTELGIGQKALAAAAGVNETYVRDILRGKSKNPQMDQLRKIAKALSTTAEALADPGLPQGEHKNGQLIKPDDETAAAEAALLRLWRIASPEGRDRIVSAIEAEIARDLASIRKANEV